MDASKVIKNELLTSLWQDYKKPYWKVRIFQHCGIYQEADCQHFTTTETLISFWVLKIRDRSVLFHLKATFLCACFIAHGSRVSTLIDFRDQRSFSSFPFVKLIPMCLLHCSWLSRFCLYWFSRPEIAQSYSICELHSYVLASLLMALQSLPLLIFEIRDRSVLFHLWATF